MNLRFFFDKREPSLEFIEEILEICESQGFGNPPLNKRANAKIYKLEKDEYGKLIENIQLKDIRQLFSSFQGTFSLWKKTSYKDYEITIIYFPYGEARHEKEPQNNLLGKIGILIDEVYFKANNEREEEICFKISEEIIDLSKSIYELINPIYGYMYSVDGDTAEEYFPTHREILDNNFRHVHRINFFSPQIVNKIDKKKLLDIPGLINNITTPDDKILEESGDPKPICWVEELSDGGFLLSLSKNPYIINYEKQKMVEKHLGFN